MPTIDTRLLVLGGGAASLVAAKIAAGRGLPCLVAGHEFPDNSRPVVLSDQALTALRPNGVLEVLRPYAAAQDPFTIAPLHFEQGLKHHCVADMLITVYDRMWFEPEDGDVVNGLTSTTVRGTLTDGTSRWDLTADAVYENDVCDLNTAIVEGCSAVQELL